MSTDDIWQQLQYGKQTFRVQVYPGSTETQDVPYVLLEDIQDHFPDAITFMYGKDLVSFMRDSNNDRLKPWRFAYRPNTITIVETKFFMSSTEALSESSPMPSPSTRTGQSPTTALQSTSASPAEKGKFQQTTALFEDFLKAVKNGQKEQANLIRGDFQQCFSALQASLDRNHDLQRQLNDMQQLMLQMQQQALDRLADMNGRVQALLAATYELHEYPIPRLFIILPKDTSRWDSLNVFNNQFQLYFLCECGEHTKLLDNNSNIPHHIHIAKHEGYELQRPTEFFQKYGRYMLTLLEMIKHGSTIAGYFVPALSAVNVSGAIDMFTDSQDIISPTAINQSIEYLQSLSSKDSEDQDPAKNPTADSLTKQEALEGADLHHLEAFLKDKDQYRALGNLYRTVTQQGHVKWVCINHYRLAYKVQDQQAFATAVELNGGYYDPHLSQVSVRLESKIRAEGFFDALAKARRLDELCRESRQAGRWNDPLDGAGTGAGKGDRGRNKGREQLSFEVVSGSDGGESLGRKGLRRLAETLKTDSTLTALDLKSNKIGDNGAVALPEALKANSALTTLNLGANSIGSDGAVALAEALKTNSTLTALDLYSNSIGDKGAVALSEALKANSTLTALDLWCNPIGDNGAVALSNVSKCGRCKILL
ncbi:hypothetical protein EC957_009435 [Mortierella hygrophila]|uniref:Uncharacterized protein n=1 Tax=Mortierella hygrophila TaxID=979708 RepID=A0A9P6JXL9_9FUNG|nr:hypothetical protein EC957_009435 [Mortierella hygrophila]